jgi:type I restriction enzyme S subunit
MSEAVQELEVSNVRRFKPYPAYKPSGMDWLGDVPEHWDVRRLKFVGDAIIGLTYDPSDLADEADGVLVLRASNVAGGRIVREDKVFVKRKIPPRLITRLGDILICSRSGSRALIGKNAKIDADSAGVTFGTFMTVFRSNCNDYLFYVFNSTLFDYQSGVFLTSTINQLTVANLYSFEVPTPPPDEQAIIVRFLEQAMANIDGLVYKKWALIGKLKEKRSALISRAVTHGLPPDAARTNGLDPNPQLKPSGVDWLGEVPTHWSVLPFTKYVSEKSDYRGATPEKVHEGVFLVTARNVRMGFIDYESSQEYVAVDAYDEIMRRGLPKKGDILVTMEAPLGNVALVDREDIALAQRIIRFRMKPTYFDSRFTLYAMMSDYFQSQLRTLSTGSTAEGLKASKLPILRLIAPPVSEQHAIAKFLDRETTKIDNMVAKVEDAISRLHEYRTGLITSAVTGKIDVRGKTA